MNSLNDIEKAKLEVDQDLKSLDAHFEELIDKVERTTDSVEDVVEFVQSPVEKFQKIATTIQDRYNVDSKSFLICVGITTVFILSVGTVLHLREKQ